MKAILLLEKDDKISKDLRIWARKEIDKIDELEIILAAQELGYGR